MSPPHVLCLSHVPWESGLERPHQVMRHLARDRQVFFVEEPRVTKRALHTVIRSVEPNLKVVSLHVPLAMGTGAVHRAHRRCISALAPLADRPLLWVYSPLMMRAARDIDPSLVVYDCVADHAARERASQETKACELALLERADLVLTAGSALFEAKRAHNVSTYPLPSSVDAAHFAARGRASTRELAKLTSIPGPRVGFLGPIDDRVDLDLVDRLAEARPSLNIVLLGELHGVTQWELPDRPNVHFLGARDYAELPDHVASWDAAIVPFRGDLATRRTEPSGLLACIAAGKPVVSTPLDELTQYVTHDLVTVAEPGDFANAIDEALAGARARAPARSRARDELLARTSWERTCSAMFRLVGEAAMARSVRPVAKEPCGRQSAPDAPGPLFPVLDGQAPRPIHAD
jgi:UDP-galactopyranose mutase